MSFFPSNSLFRDAVGENALAVAKLSGTAESDEPNCALKSRPFWSADVGLSKKPMKQLLIVPILISLTSYKTLAQLSAEVPSNYYLEIVSFQVKESSQDSFDEAQSRAFASLSKMKGFVSAESYKDVTNDLARVDLLLWETLEDARQAADQFKHALVLQSYAACLDAVTFSGHGKLIENGQIGARPTGEESVLEFITYKVKPQLKDQYLDARAPIFDYLKASHAGFQSAKTYSVIEEQDVMADLVFWDSVASHKQALEASAKEPVFGPFVEAIGEVKVAGDFVRTY